MYPMLTKKLYCEGGGEHHFQLSRKIKKKVFLGKFEILIVEFSTLQSQPSFFCYITSQVFLL